MGVPGHLQMLFEAQKTAIAMPPGIDEDRLDLPIAIPSRNDAGIGQFRILDVNMDRVSLEPLPIAQWTLTDLHKIRKIKGTAQFWRVDRLHQVQAIRALLAVNVLLVLVDESNVLILDVFHLGRHPLENLIAKLVHILIGLGRVIAENTDHRGTEELRQLNGQLESLKMSRPGLVDLRLANRAANAHHAKAVFAKLGFDLLLE